MKKMGLKSEVADVMTEVDVDNRSREKGGSTRPLKSQTETEVGVIFSEENKMQSRGKGQSHRIAKKEMEETARTARRSQKNMIF